MRTLLIALLALGLAGYAEAQSDGEGRPPQPALKTDGLETIDATLSLERCIEIALTKNPEIAAAQWEVSTASSRFDAAKAAFWPQVSIEGAFQQYVDSQRLIAARKNGELGVFDDNLLFGNLVAKMNLYSGGRTTSEAGAAEKLSQAEAKRFIRTRDELIYGVTTVFYSILGQQKIISSLEFSRSALAEHLTRVNQLYEVQKAAKVDILRTEVRITNLKQSMIKEENALAGQKRLLFNLMGLDLVPENALFAQELKPSEASLDIGHLIETAMHNRPDYKAAKDGVEAQALRVDAAKAGHYPSANVIGSYGVRNAPSPEDVGKNTESTEDSGFIGFVLTVPLFEGGRVSAKVSEEKAALSAAKERLRKLELQIRQETETATLDVLANKARIMATEKSIEQAKESFRIESLKYDLGKGSITDVLDAASAQLDAETTYYRAVIDYHISMAKLKLATGGTI